MNTSENLSELGKALAAAQTEITNPAKNKNNPHFKSSYADLAGGLDTIRPVLGKHGLSVIQMTRAEGDMVFLYTRLLHTSGQWVESTYPVCRMGKHQEMMSALTYSRRACLFALCGVAGEDEDDDGNAAGTARGRPAAAAPSKSSYAIKKNDPELWPTIEKEVRAGKTRDELDALWLKWRDDVAAMPKVWQDQADELWLSQIDAIEGLQAAE